MAEEFGSKGLPDEPLIGAGLVVQPLDFPGEEGEFSDCGGWCEGGVDGSVDAGAEFAVGIHGEVEDVDESGVPGLLHCW